MATAPARAVVASLGAFVPAPPRPARYVEQERPDALETYRAPRPAPHASRHEARAKEMREEHRSSARPQSYDGDDDTAETGSLRRRREHGQDEHRFGRHEDARRAPQIARRDPAETIRGHGVQRAEAPMPPPHRAITTGSRMLPPSRPVHVAALATPVAPHKRMAAPRGRSHDD